MEKVIIQLNIIDPNINICLGSTFTLKLTDHTEVVIKKLQVYIESQIESLLKSLEIEAAANKNPYLT